MAEDWDRRYPTADSLRAPSFARRTGRGALYYITWEHIRTPASVCARCVPSKIGDLGCRRKYLILLVEPRGIEPLTSAVRLQRSPI